MASFLTVVALAVLLVTTFTEQALLAPLCPCAAHIPRNFCTCQAGLSPLCSCKAIVPTPSCACAVQAHVTQCRSSCQQVCLSTCSNRLLQTCPSSCRATCAQSCVPQQAVPMQVVIPRVALPAQCPGACRSSCQKFCGIHPTTSCIPQCQNTCVQKCGALAVPVQKPVHMVAQPLVGHPVVAQPVVGQPIVAHPNPAPLMTVQPVAQQGCGGEGCGGDSRQVAFPSLPSGGLSPLPTMDESQLHYQNPIPREANPPDCVEECMPKCDPQCIMEHYLKDPMKKKTNA